MMYATGEIEDTRLEAKDKKNPWPRQTLSRPRTGMLKDTSASVLKKIFFSGDLRKKRSSKKIFLAPEFRRRGFYVQAYADGVAVLVTGADMLWIKGMALKAINIAANWASEQELQFSSKKTEIVQFTYKRNPDLGSFSMNGSKLELSKEAKLLGVTLDSKLTWKPHITRKATTTLMQCRQIVGYDEMDIHSYDTSNHVVCVCVLGWRSQQKVSREETHKGAEICLPDDFISFSWHPYWCSGNIAQHNSH